MQTPLKIGIVGLDTSHCVAFTELFNDEHHPHHVPGARVVAAYPGGSEMFSLSRDRVQGFTKTLREKYDLKLYDMLSALIRDVDAILLESVDGRQHLEQFRQLAMGKPVFIDKPLATSTAEARALLEIAEETHTPVMSASALRYAAGIANLVAPGAPALACEAYGPAPILEDYPGLFWYGIHSAEILFAMMGGGCRAVRALSYPAADIVIGEWADGRLGILNGTRIESHTFGCVVHRADGTRASVAGSDPPYYALLLKQVVSFLQTGVSPILPEETFEIIAFLEAADLSKAQGGKLMRVVE
ncbi:MAG: Gfo/Idh/MocA family oxidoreductase [Anaerolineae bacterium]|nr:Gfo/Idh/MocA family oxidoreductase [Anaerolineae bacterium]